MNLTDVLHQIAQDSMEGYGLSDMTIGTVTGVKPLKVKIREGMTETALDPDAYTSDERLGNIVCYEDNKPLPVKDGYIILNRALEAGDKVLMLRVMRGQQFIILSRIFEKEAQ